MSVLGRMWDSVLGRACLMITSVILAVTILLVLENHFGVASDTTYRVICAIGCLAFIAELALKSPEETWPKAAFVMALLVNAGLFFTPIFDRPASRGEIMLFALPDIVITLSARLAGYPAADDRQRAIRQQLILGLTVAAIFGTVLFAAALNESK